MGKLRYILFMFILIGMFILLMFGTVVEHEYLHQLIFKNYGIDSNVTYYFKEAFIEQINPKTWFNINMMNMTPSGVTYPDQNSTGQCNETCEMLHTQVEIVEHGSTNVVMALFMFIVLLIMYFEFFKTDVKKEFRQAIKEEANEQEMKMLKDEYEKLTGKSWKTHMEFLEEDLKD